MSDYQIVYLTTVIVLLLLCYLFGTKRTLFRRVSIVLFISFQFIYLVWRSIYTLPQAGWISLLAGILLLFTEWAGFSQNIVTSKLFWKKYRREKVPLSALSELPKVDFLIATYNESVDLLRRTIAASKLIDYPQDKVTIYVCDDGNREDVRILCEELGVKHVTRQDNKHAKAGNLNHALSVSEGEIVVTMDADMIPRSNFLTETLGYFSNDQTAFVQAPQAFYNDDPFQFNLFAGDRISNEQDFFMRSIEEQKDQFNATMYVGSNALFRRSALEKIGGFATGVITEDMATGMLIQAEGYQTVFVNEVIAVGLAPETYKDLLKQRDRWGRGNIQVLRKFNPLKIKGLSLIQKILYLDGAHYWFFGVYKIIYLTAPILYLVFGVIVIDADFLSLLSFWIPSFLSSMIFAHLISDKKRTVMWSNVYDIALAPAMAWAMISEVFLKKNLTFNVTRKGVYSDVRNYLWRASIYHILLGVLSLTGLVRGIIAYVRPEWISLQVDSLYINVFWTLYNLVGLVIVMLIFFERPRYRTTERFITSIKASVEKDGMSVPIELIDFSEKGARVSGPKEQFKNKLEKVSLKVEDGPSFEAEVRWMNEKENRVELGLEFISLSIVQYSYIVEKIYSDPDSGVGEKSYYKPGLLATAVNFFKQSQKVPLSQRRMLVREKRMTNALITYKDLNYSASLIDLSEEGSQIKTKLKLTQGDIAVLDAPSENLHKVKGDIRWTKRKLGTTYAGVKFID